MGLLDYCEASYAGFSDAVPVLSIPHVRRAHYGD